MQVEVKSPLEADIKKWMPEPKQERFISIPYDIFEAFYGGV